MVTQASLEAVPAELLYYLCEYLPLADIAALDDALKGRPHDIVHKYMMSRGLRSTRHPLHELVKLDRADCVEELVAQSVVDVNKKDQLGRTALHIAAEKGVVAVVNTLLHIPHINMNVEDKYGNTPLGLAIWKKHLGVVELLLGEGAAHEKALGLAVKVGYLELVKALVRMPHIDVNETNETNCSPLLLAVNYGRVNMYEELLSRVDINTELREHRNLWTPLLLAAARGQSSCLIRLLTQGGANVHVSDRDERTALSLAAEGGYLTTTAVLLCKNVDPNRVDRLGRNCLHYAVQGGHERVVEALLREGCNVQQLDSAGMTPIRLAVKMKNDTIMEMMLRAAGDVDYRALLIHAAEYNNAWVAKRALRHVNPNFKHNDVTPLLTATKPLVIKTLLGDPRIDPNLFDQNGRTVLINAVRLGLKSVVQRLVSRNGLNIDHLDNNRQSAEKYAADLKFKPIHELLLEYSLKKSGLQRTWCQEAGSTEQPKAQSRQKYLS